MEILQIYFGERLKQLRVKHNLRQADLAKIFNVRPATLSRWENGIIEPDYLTLANISRYFNVSSDFLLGIG